MNLSIIRKAFVAVFIAVAFGTKADEETVGEYTWTYQIADGTVEITGVSPSPSGAMAIPSSLGGKTVTDIGSQAFSACTEMTEVVIPESVTRIGWNAFLSCSGLESVTIPRGVAAIESGAFSYCNGLKTFTVAADNAIFKAEAGLLLTKDGTELVAAPGGLESVAIPVGVMVVGYHAFDGCVNLKEVSIPNGVRRIASGAFADCIGLESVTLPNSVTNIEYCAFLNCSGIVRLKIGMGVTVVGNSAFYGCNGLKTVELPEGFNESLAAKILKDCPEDVKVTYGELLYEIRFHRNDSSSEAVTNLVFAYGEATRLPSLANNLGWARRGFTFKGWATSEANVAAGKVWKADWAYVSTAAGVGETLDVWAVWELKPDCYAIRFIRNDGAGTWRTVGFVHGEKTRMPSLANGLGWARRGYEFKGWELTTANANDNTREAPWKGDWAYIAEPTEKGSTLTVYARWELREGYYQIRFNKNDGSGKWRTLGFEVGTSTKLSTMGALGWEREGCQFVGWGSNAANAAEGKVWKDDGAWVKDATAEGRTLSIYAIWK